MALYGVGGFARNGCKLVKLPMEPNFAKEFALRYSVNWLGNMQQLLLWKQVEVDQRYHFPAIDKTNFITRSIIETLQ